MITSVMRDAQSNGLESNNKQGIDNIKETEPASGF